MKLGIIGTGMIANEVLSFIHEIKEIEVVAICGTPKRQTLLDELCKKHHIKKNYTNTKDLLNDQDVEVVYVATPNHLHYQMTKDAILAHKDVICEKPFTSNIKELEELIDLASRHHQIIIEALTTHYLPNMKQLKKDVLKLGNIRISSANFSQYSSRYDAFKEGTILPAFNKAMSGGALMDLNVYNINFIAGLFGRPNKVDYQANIEKGIDTSGILTLDYGSHKAVCIGAKDCKAPVTTTIQGDQGHILIPGPVSILESYTVTSNTERNGTKVDLNGKYHRMYHEFVAMQQIIDSKNYDKVKEMLELSHIEMDIISRAKASASIVFDADKNQFNCLF